MRSIKEKLNKYSNLVSLPLLVSGSLVLSQFLRLLSNLVLTRLLEPSLFGIMLAANLIMMALDILSDVGISQNIIRSKRVDHAFINTLWTMQIIRGMILFSIGLISAYVIYILDFQNYFNADSVFSNDLFPYVVAVLSITTIVKGLQSTKKYHAYRELNLKRVLIIEISSQVGGAFFSIGLALVFPSIWALVFGYIAASVIASAMSHFYLQGLNNSFHFSSKEFKQALSFSKWIFISSVIGYLANSSDKWVLANLVDQ